MPNTTGQTKRGVPAPRNDSNKNVKYKQIGERAENIDDQNMFEIKGVKVEEQKKPAEEEEDFF